MMQQYQCIKQPKDISRNIYRRFFVVLEEFSDNIELYCEDLDLCISISEVEFLICFVKYPYATNIIKEEKEKMNKQYESEDKMVSHPDHYQSSNGVECIDAIKSATENLTGIFATDTGNIIKYAWRWNDKGTPIRDIEKIIWYATHLLNEVKAREENEKIASIKQIVGDPDRGCCIPGTPEDLEDLFKQSVTLKSN
jgi:hypothetical protein